MSDIWSDSLSGTTFAIPDNSENTWFRVTPSFAEQAHSTSNLMSTTLSMSSWHVRCDKIITRTKTKGENSRYEHMLDSLINTVMEQ